jgi:3',5'-cyclic AMP phosphodiesterase CpdA
MKIIHLSDLHFGTETPDIVGMLEAAIEKSAPDLVIISGDFTQVASRYEFKTACRFIDRLSCPVFTVPGNHDIPPYNLMKRFLQPYKRYKRFINDNLCPTFETDTTIIAGLNSARRIVPHWNWSNGAISAQQLEKLEEVYTASPGKRRICVFHHPIHMALNMPMDTVVFGAKQALSQINKLKVDLVLTGHVHHASITTLGDVEHRTTYLSASTALSSRTREQENGFNVIHMTPSEMAIEIHTLAGNGFDVTQKYVQEF